MPKELFCDIILPFPLNQLFTYSVPSDLEDKCVEGVRVVVQFGKKKLYSGIVRYVHHNKPKKYVTKPIISILDEKPVIDEFQFRFWEWIAGYYMCTLGEVYKAALPSGLKLESETKIVFNSNLEIDFDLNSKEEMVLNILEKENVLTIDKIASITQDALILKTINSLVKKKAVILEEKIKDTFKPLYEDFIQLDDKYTSQENLNALFDDLKRAHQQTKLVMAYLTLSEFREAPIPVEKKKLLEKAEVNTQILNPLLKKGIFVQFQKKKSRLESNIDENELLNKTLNEAQLKAFSEIKELHNTKDVVLLHGVTSSGKTEVYIKYIQEVIEQGKQVLYLLPEIALTAQIINRLKLVFGNSVGIYHSKFNEAERVEIWKNIHENNENSYKVILGVRSSVYLPFKNLGLIIVDEEHENTYKQFDPAPRYNARDASIVLANIHQSKVLLGTATPAIESFYNAQNDKYGFVELQTRYKDILLPEIVLANTRDAYRKKQMNGHFHPILLDQIQGAIENNEQVILFQNRRGFAPYLECELCSSVPYCKYCDVSLTYHKHSNSLVCHYCGYTEKNDGVCWACKNPSLSTKGFGTEKIEDEVALFFPEAKVARMDLDTTRSKNAYYKIISEFENKQIDILVGTQMISKGLDFDNVSVVGVLNADNMLNFPDFRAFERSYQLIAQVSGRAGRLKKQGKVIIQTSDPKHKVIQHLLENDYYGLYSNQLKERKQFNYPPFHRLIELTLKHKHANICNKASYELAQQLKSVFGKRVKGPNTPVISKIQNYFLQKILIKIESESSQKKAKQLINESIQLILTKDEYKALIVFADVDPQ